MRRKQYLLCALTIVSLAAFLFLSAGCGEQKRPVSDAQYDVIIIGGGMGGLSAGAHLASKGLKVLLLEQHHKVGGCTTNFTRGDFTFEVALHVMAGGIKEKNGGLYKLMEACGVDKKIEVYELPDLYRSIYPDVDFTVPAESWDAYTAAFKERWPEESAGIDKFETLCHQVLGDIMSIKNLFRETGFRALLTKVQIPFRQRTLLEWKDKTLQDSMDECFTDPQLKAVMSQLWMYYSGPADDQTSLLNFAATNMFLTDGVCHVMGTSQAMSNAYAERIKELGGEVKVGTLATKIIIEDGIATGVQTEYGDVYTARYVVCNTDPYQLVFKLIGEENLPKKYVQKIKDMRPANSLFGVYLGLNIDLNKLGYTDTDIIYNKSYSSNEIYDKWMTGDIRDSACLIGIYSNYGDPTYAPPGKSLLNILTYSDTNLWPKDYDEYQAMKKEKAADLVALAAEVIPEIADPRNVEVMEVITPVTIEEFTKNYQGSPYGFYMSLDQWDKIPNNTPIDNVFIASNWTQGFHGVAAGQVNGWRAARLILDREGIE
ncbi:MAG: NAD(P)/FAD-dependent oxidoreductase [Deltaproteobacteria bacterium]|nr:NAD(P)/FAD-dependent oxidoreductase [Candidatus Zymogenaceae bacterium]